MEGFKPANNNEKGESAESLEAWRELKDEASVKAVEILTQQGLEADIETASAEELEQIVAQLPSLIEELSYDEAGEVKNENRYLARALSVYLEKAVRKQKYEEIELPQVA